MQVSLCLCHAGVTPSALLMRLSLVKLRSVYGALYGATGSSTSFPFSKQVPPPFWTSTSIPFATPATLNKADAVACIIMLLEAASRSDTTFCLAGLKLQIKLQTA